MGSSFGQGRQVLGIRETACQESQPASQPEAGPCGSLRPAAAGESAGDLAVPQEGPVSSAAPSAFIVHGRVNCIVNRMKDYLIDLFLPPIITMF